MDRLQLHIEALIFTSPAPLRVSDLNLLLEKLFEREFTDSEIEEVIDSIRKKYKKDAHPFELKKSGGGLQFLTKKDYYRSVAELLNLKSKRRLSKSALESLSIIAYKQPVTRSEIEQIRGVNCDYAVSKLLEKELIEILGRADRPGKPLIYGTSEKFMDYFGINSVEELPQIKEFEKPTNEIGEGQA